MDFEDLTEYLSNLTSERDRLAAVISGRAGSTGLGLGAYLKDKVDALRGADDDRSRVEKMRKLDGKIKELEDAVSVAHDTSDAFSEETLREQKVFQHAKDAEMKEMLGNLADGQIEFYKAVSEIASRCSFSTLIFVLGYGGVGENNTNHSAYTSGRVVHYLLRIHMFMSTLPCILSLRIIFHACPNVHTYSRIISRINSVTLASLLFAFVVVAPFHSKLRF